MDASTIEPSTTTVAPTAVMPTTTAAAVTTTTAASTPGCRTLSQIADLDAAFDPDTADGPAFEVYLAEAIRLRERLEDDLPNASSFDAMAATSSAEFIAEVLTDSDYDLAGTANFFRQAKAQGVDLANGEAVIVTYANARCDLSMESLQWVFADR